MHEIAGVRRLSTPWRLDLLSLALLGLAIVVATSGVGRFAETGTVAGPAAFEPSVATPPSASGQMSGVFRDPFDLPRGRFHSNCRSSGVRVGGRHLGRDAGGGFGRAAIAVKAVPPDQLVGPSAEALRTARQADLVLGDRVIDITPPAPYDHGEYLPADLQLVLPLTTEQIAEATARNVGVVHLSTRGPVYLDGYYDPTRSAVVVHVPHLSGFISFRRDPMREITKPSPTRRADARGAGSKRSARNSKRSCSSLRKTIWRNRRSTSWTAGSNARSSWAL